MTRAIVTSPDGQWAAVRRDRVVAVHAAGAGPAVGRLELTSDDVELAMVGPPSVLAVLTRAGDKATLTLHEPPFLEVIASLDMDRGARLVAVTGTRLAIAPPNATAVKIVRAAGRSIASQVLELGATIELAVGLDKNQVLFSLPRKLEVWDAVFGRPLLRPQLQLPPPPRTIGCAAGHLWATRPGSDEVFVYRLSDGRPFRHLAGAPVEGVICHPASPVIVLVTARGLVRLQCYAHSLQRLDDTPWRAGTALAQLVVGDDTSLLGIAADDVDGEPWRVAIRGVGAPLTAELAEAAPPVSEPTGADKLQAMRSRATSPVVRSTWREALVTYGQELVRAGDGASMQSGANDAPLIAINTELGELSERLSIGSTARRALLALYASYLVGEPRLTIAKLARIVGDWAEPLGQGELAALGLVDRADGRVALRSAVANLLDGAPPLAIRIVGDAPTTPRAGLFRIARDPANEAELATQLGRIAIVEGDLATAIIEARIHGATAIALDPPALAPRLPSGAGLAIVADGELPRWLATLPPL